MMAMTINKMRYTLGLTPRHRRAQFAPALTPRRSPLLSRNFHIAFRSGYFPQQDLNNALCGVAIPERRYVALLTFSAQDLCSGTNNLGRVPANQQIRSLGNGHRALGVFAQRQAGDA